MKTSSDPFETARAWFRKNPNVIKVAKYSAFGGSIAYFFYKTIVEHGGIISAGFESSAAAIIAHGLSAKLLGKAEEQEQEERLKRVFGSTTSELRETLIAKMEEVLFALNHPDSAPKANLKPYGFNRFVPELDFGALLKRARGGQRLLVNDTFISHLESLRASIVEACARGVEFRVMILDLECPWLKLRAQDLDYWIYADFATAALKAHELLFEIKRQVQRNHCPGQLLICESFEPPGEPIYLLEWADKNPILARTSHYLGVSTSAFPFMEWVPAKQSMLQYLHQHMKTKWDRNACRHDLV